MSENRIGLIAMDMDGTLLNTAQQISAENLAALREAEARGVRLAICSGRLPGDAGLFAVEAGLSHCAILSLNGGYCQERPMGEPYANHPMPEETFQACRALLTKSGITYGSFIQNRLVIQGGDLKEGAIEWGSHTQGEGAPTYFYGPDELTRLSPEGVNKLVCVGERREQLTALRAQLEKLPGIAVTSSWDLNLEIMPDFVDKGTAVLELARHLGLDGTQVMALGDYDNDEPMISRVGFGVAMGNATALIKRAAKYETLTNDQDGVAAAVRRFVLC